LNLLLSAAGAAYGAFIPVYLTGRAWTQTQIGLVLTIGTITAVLCLLPAGMLIDAARAWRRRILAGALLVGALAPLLFAALPQPLFVSMAVVLQAAAASLFTPAIAAISLGVAGHAGLGERLGRNARYGSIGAGLGAAMLGACSIWGGERGVFVLAAILTMLGLLALRRIGPDRTDAAVEPEEGGFAGWRASVRLLRDRRLLVFALCLVLFQVASIAVVQLAAVEATRRMGAQAGMVIAAMVIVPQVVAAWLAPWIGRYAERWGRRRVLLAGFATVPVRDVLFAVIRHPLGLVPVQTLEGAGGAVFGVMIPLVAADLTRSSGFYTSCLGLLGLAGSLGSAVSTSLAGWIADRFGRPAAYWALAVIGLLALAVLWWAMPETSRRRIARPDGLLPGRKEHPGRD
jgi:MFS family permease